MTPGPQDDDTLPDPRPDLAEPEDGDDDGGDDGQAGD